MIDFIINEPGHKRWWLPDARHQYNSVIWGDTIRWSIIDSWSGDTKLSGHISLSDPQWENLSDLSQKLAAKKYPRTIRAIKQRR
jgi:hypothetical protein